MRYLLLVIALFLPLIAGAQLTAPGASAVRYTTYPSSPAKDPVFIYCNTLGTEKGTLNAVSPGGTAPFNFAWFMWSDVTKSFSIPVKTETGVSASSASNLAEGGYQIVISGGYSATLTGWIFIDKPYATAELKNRTCDYVALKGLAAVDTFYYRNPAGGAKIKLPNGFNFLWSSTPSSAIPFPDLEINPITYSPPLVDVKYKLQVSDSFGCVSSSTFDYTSIHVKAEFTPDPEKGEAPLKVSFTDKSIRGYIYKWEFGDGKDSISSQKDPPPHTYFKPGEYTVKLTIESELHCIDSVRFDKIVVEPSELNIPNVFTPDGDGLNDLFMVDSKSLKMISVEVFSRSGLKVYGFYGEGERLRNWTGWDGNINNTSIKAAPGVYFFLIRALGWDDIDYNGKEHRGFVYLYR